MLRVIINADDLGASQQVNDAIEACIKKGIITSSTVIAGGDSLRDASRIAKSYAETISFGVHLTLDEFDSITHSPILQKYGLIDDKGRFIKNGYKKVSDYTEELLAAIRDEWDAQIKTIKDLGIKPSHADGHHHCHTIPQLKRVLLAVLLTNGISKVRLPQSRTFKMRLHGIDRPINAGKDLTINSESIKRQPLIRAIMGSYKDHRRLIWYKRHFTTVDFFSSVSFMVVNKRFIIENYPNYSMELMCHPGHPKYQVETEALNSIFKEFQMINYNQLFY